MRTLRNAAVVLAISVGVALHSPAIAEGDAKAQGDARAQADAAYPSRPLRVIVPSTAGGPIDTFARLVGAELNKRFGQPVVVENRPGGGLAIAMDVIVKAAGDPYTLLFSAHSVGFSNLAVKNPNYDPARDVTPIGILGGAGFFLSVPATLPVKSMAELVAYVRANPGKLNMGEAGVPTPEIEDMLGQLGMRLERVNYKGGGPMYSALLAGEIQLALTNALQSASNGGKLRTLAYTDLKRHPTLPAVPTVAESVLPNFQSRVWQGLFGPANISPPVVAKLNAEMRDMLKSPEVLDKVLTVGYQPMPLDVEATRSEFNWVIKHFQALAAKGLITPQ